jgi:hypothetical protein
MNTNWAAARKELKALGIKVNTSLKGCCLGCNESVIDETVPAIYQLRSRWNSFDGGALNHQNIGDTFLAAQVMAILNRNEPAFYCIPAKAYEELMNRLEDMELNALADSRMKDGKAPVRVALDDL